GTMFRSGYMENLAWPAGPLLAYDQTPFYPDVWNAVSDWMGIKKIGSGSDMRYGRVLVFLPECRGRIEAVSRGDERATLTVDKVRDVALDLRLKGAWKQRGVPRNFDIALSKTGREVCELAAPKEAEGFWAVLISSDGILDSYSEERRFFDATD